ncbi:MAG TPA: type III polyketide synthase [Planktothrix sp.]|jgi:predicted naringenin-chalcone synthase
MPANILAIATALPATSASQDLTCELAKTLCCDNQQQGRALEQIFKRTSIQRRFSDVFLDAQESSVQPMFYSPRHTSEATGPSTAARMSRYHKSATKLAELVCERVMKIAGIDISNITHLVTVSCTGFSSPGVDLHLVENLNLPRSIARTHVGFMGCHGALNGLRVAQSFCQANQDAVVLLCATEICSVHFQYGWDHNAVVANSLFSDGSAALIMSGSTQWSGQHIHAASASYVVPDTADVMTWQIGDNGFSMTLSPKLPEIIQQQLPQFVESWLSDNGMRIEDVGGWAVHPGGPRILQATETCLGLNAKALELSKQVLSEFGNMSSPTILFIVDRLRANNCPKPWVLLAFGPGLTIEAALIR